MVQLLRICFCQRPIQYFKNCLSNHQIIQVLVHLFFRFGIYREDYLVQINNKRIKSFRNVNSLNSKSSSRWKHSIFFSYAGICCVSMVYRLSYVSSVINAPHSMEYRCNVLKWQYSSEGLKFRCTFTEFCIYIVISWHQ